MIAVRRQPAPLLGLLCAVVASVAVNGLLALAILHLQAAPQVPSAPLATMPLRRPEVPPAVALPLPQPPPAPAAAALPALPAVVAPPLPALALPALALPGMPLLANDLPQPPVASPETAASAASAAVAAAPSVPTVPTAPDDRETPPQRRDPLDSARYYPRQARLRGTEGSSTVRLDIDDQGTVVRVQVLRSDPPGVFDSAAESLARALRFEPMRRGGTAVPCSITQEIQWRPR